MSPACLPVFITIISIRKEVTIRARLYESVALLLLACITRAALPQDGSGRPDPVRSNLSLSNLLDQIQTNIIFFEQSVPNLYCTELANAVHTSGGEPVGPDLSVPGGAVPAERSRKIEDKTSVTSVFRLRRTNEIGQVGVFEESRIVQSVNGKSPASHSQNIPMPAILYGIFSNGLNIFSREAESCFRFKLHAEKKQQIEIDFSDLPQKERSADCPAFARTTGRVLVDSASMHVVKIEKSVPRIELVPGVFGHWDWREEYAPITLNDKTFWMPRKIVSKSAAEDGSEVWTFEGTYSRYHLFHAQAHIVPLTPE